MLGGGVDAATLVVALGAGPPPPELSLQSLIVEVNHAFISHPPLAKAILLQYYCTIIAQYKPHLPCCMPYTIQDRLWQYRHRSDSRRLHVTGVTAASSGTSDSRVSRVTHTHTRWWCRQASRPCADTGAPNNGMCRYRRGAAEIPAGVSVPNIV